VKTSYDLEYLPKPRKNGSREAPEITEIKSFLACKRQNMCFEYDNAQQARNRLKVVQRFRSGNGLQEVFECYRVEKCVYVLRTKNGGKKCK
jgi:hypothetical protein